MFDDNKREIVLLVTDDETDILELVESELSEMDDTIRVIKANMGYQALSIIQNSHIDILLTDIAMPDLDGYELYQRAKEIRPDLPIIMMTGFGYDPNHTVVNTKKIGLKDVLFKPFEVCTLLKMINKSLGIKD